MVAAPRGPGGGYRPRVALLHQATLTPTRLELLSAWIPHQPWLGGADTAELTVLGAYRFDDPDGEVGIETHLLAAGTAVLQVPVTYRAAPLPGAQAALIATTEHSVLGRRWVYDATADPVHAAALATAVLHGGTQADIDVATPTGLRRRAPTTLVTGSGSTGAGASHVRPGAGTINGPVATTTVATTTVIVSGDLELVVLHVVDRHVTSGPPALPALTGTWPGQDSPALLAYVRAA